MEDIMRHQPELHLPLKEGLTGGKVEVHIGGLPPLRQVMSAYEMPIELQGGILGQAEIVDAANGPCGAVLTDTAFVGGTEVMEGEVAIGCELPPRGGLGCYLKFKVTPTS